MYLRRSTVVRLFLALLLVFAQQQATLHALGHDFERFHQSSKDVTQTDEAFCAKCLAVAHLDHANGVAWSGAVLVSYAPPRFARAQLHSATLAFAGGYLSRAPPAFS